MNTEIKTVIGYLLFVMGAFLTSARFLTSMANFMKYANISIADVCLILLLSGGLLYQNLKRKAQEKEVEALKTQIIELKVRLDELECDAIMHRAKRDHR